MRAAATASHTCAAGLADSNPRTQLQAADQVLNEATPALETTASHLRHEMVGSWRRTASRLPPYRRLTEPQVYSFAPERDVAAAVESQADKTKLALKRLFEEGTA